MSQEAERVYTINLGKVWLSPNNRRAKRAINMIREFATRHMKTEQIKIDQDLSQTVWKNGIRSPPRKIRVKMAKTEEGYVLVSPYGEEKKVEEKVEEIPREVKPKESEVKVEEIQEKIEEVEEKPASKEKKIEKKPEAKKVSEEKPKKSEKMKESKPAKKADSKKSKKK
ncbi:MAG: 50S ribosomal protein L31e [Candidatus Nitrosotenuis sp.]